MKSVIVASFSREEDIIAATRQARRRGLHIVDVYTPYAVHGLDEAMGLGPSRLSWACFFFGLLGVAVAFVFQFWSTTIDWPLNVGGKPWNSWPAFVPVAFELMVLLGGLGLVFTFFLRSGLFPGKQPEEEIAGVTSNSFVLVVAEAETDTAMSAFQDCNAIYVEKRNGQGEA
jgi:hypothetical protein